MAPAIPLRARLADDADWSAEPVDVSRIGRPGRKFSWLSPRTLWHSRNNVLASLSGDPTENARRAWVAAQREKLAGEGRALSEDFMIERDDLGDFAFMLIGDTGEGDLSQYAVAPTFNAVGADSEFAIIASDVIYPAGDVNDYVEKFFVPFAGYRHPVYAIPGNHDWLDGLVGFMRHFCGAKPPEEKFRPPRRQRWARLALLVHHLFWRRPRELAGRTLAEGAALRGEAQASGPAQPNMYFAIDTPQLRIVCIDTGILGRLDHDQGQWLARVSAGDKPKLLVSGKPVFAGPDASPRRILPADGSDAGYSDLLWNVIRDPANNYVAMLAGDVHHYERHMVHLPDGRELPCVISGGGGAFMTSTHQIGKVDRPEFTESDWVVFPTRGDSLRAYSMVIQRRLARVIPLLRRDRLRGIPADQAALIAAERHRLDPDAELARGERAPQAPPAARIKVSMRSRMLTWLVWPRRAWYPVHRISEALDWDDPPFFKNFVRAEVAGGQLRMVAYAVSGLQRDAEDPAVIDELRIPLAAGVGARR